MPAAIVKRDQLFIADAMLGRLATWMRILGCDVYYHPAMGDLELIGLARRDGRTILTRDTRLVRRRAVRDIAFLVGSDHYREQLHEVIRHFSIDPETKLLSRCLRCNVSLVPLGRSAASGRVPPYVHDTQSSFESCPSCSRVYWGGTHREKIVEELRRIADTAGPGLQGA